MSTLPFRSCLAAAAGAALLCAASVGVAAAFALDEIAPGVYVHPGQMADLDSPARGDSANLGVVVGDRCVAVIDSGGSLATGRALAAAIAARTPRPVCYVINTHVHFDHVLGNGAFVGEGTHFVGQHGLAEAMEANREFFAEQFADELDGSGGAARVIAPDDLVDSRLELDLGGRTLVLTAVARAHSSTDLTVLDRTSNTLFAGDLVFRERLPVLDGSLGGWLDWLDAAMQVDYARVVPGHGPVDTHWPEGARALRRYLVALRDDTRAAIAAGEFLEDAKASVAASERDEWILTGRAHGLNVSRAYRELEWE
ncbi:MAG: quinoprotein relay system zinc metallohydrolase 2 [Gammaproteobacteria bacterium]|nr:quinoprotein relay system zinc metallohydrolase 2 [Gammaproteobacteria bacterium]